MPLPAHYRYRDILTEDGIYITLETFRVIKETDCGYWIQPVFGYTPDLTDEMISRIVSKATRPSNVRWVSKDSSRRYCYPTRRQAMEAFRCRKSDQINHAKASLAKAEQSLAAANILLSVGDTFPRCRHTGDIKAGMPPYYAGMTFY